MDWADLETLLFVSRTGGAAAAGDALGVSHATVSRRISEIEKRHGITLVDRSGLGWKVTPLCKSLAAQAALMEQHHGEAMRLARAFSQETSGHVRISVPTGAVASFCGRALKKLRSEAPEIGIIFITEDNLADVAGRKADLAVRFTNSPDLDLIGEKAVSSEWGFFCNAIIEREIGLAQEAGILPLVPLLTSSTDGAFPDWANGVFDPRSTCHFAYGFMDKASLATAGFGVAHIPLIVAAVSPSLVQLASPKSSIKNELWVLANADTRSSKRISIVKKLLIEGLKSLSHEFANNNFEDS